VCADTKTCSIVMNVSPRTARGTGTGPCMKFAHFGGVARGPLASDYGCVAEDQGNNADRAVERVTIAEAAALLGCHPNTVRSRVKAGMYRAEKFHTENGPTWMIERDSLTDSAPTTAPQQPTSGVPAAQQEAIQELARAIVREAGLQRDPDIERAREDIHGKLDMLKHTSTLNAATVVALLLLHRAWELNDRLVAVTLGVVGISFLLALLGLIGVSSWLGSTEYELRQYTFGRYYWITFLSTCLLWVGMGLFLFSVFAGPEP
jgi:hypothetical protein